MPERSLVYPIIFDHTRARTGVAEAETSLARLDRAVVRSTGLMGGLGKSIAAGFAAGAIVDFGRDAVSAALDAEKALTRAKSLAEAAGISWAQYGEAVESAVDAQSKMSGFDDEALLRTWSQFARVTKDANEALKLNALAMDLSRGKGMDLEAAGNLLLKVYQGNYGALKRLGIATGDVHDAQAALAAVQKQFAGSAEDYGNSAAGAADKMKVQWENAKEAIGEGMLPILQQVAEAIQAIDTLLEKSKIKDLIEWLGSVTDSGSGTNIFSGWVAQARTIFGGATGAIVPGTPPADPRADNVLAMVRSREAILTEPMQHDLGMARVMEVIRRHGGKVGGSRFAAGGWATTGYTTFGGPRDSSVDMSNPRGYRGDNLLNYPYSFAELQMGTALGGLPYKAKLLVRAPNGRAVVVEKRDIGGGQGDDYYDIDLWYRASEALGLGNYNKGSLQFQRVAGGTPVGPFRGAAAPVGERGSSPATSSPVGGAVGAAGGVGTGPFYPTGTRGDIIGRPYQGTHTLGNWQSDNAVDIGVPVGTPIVAVEDGTIVKIAQGQSARTNGYQVTMAGKSGQMYFYGHLETLADGVKPGAKVRAGQAIGTSGTGNSVPHLHFGVQRGSPLSLEDAPLVSASGAPAGQTPVTPLNQTGATNLTPGSPIIGSIGSILSSIGEGAGGANTAGGRLAMMAALPAILAALQASGAESVSQAGGLLDVVTNLFGGRTANWATSLQNIFRNAGIRDPKGAVSAVRQAEGDFAGLIARRAGKVDLSRLEQTARINAGRAGRAQGLSPDRIGDLQDEAAQKAQANGLRQMIRIYRTGIKQAIRRRGEAMRKFNGLTPGKPGYKQSRARYRALIADWDGEIAQLQEDEKDLIAQLGELNETIEAEDYADDYRAANAPLAGPGGTAALGPRSTGTGRYDPDADSRRIGGPAGRAVLVTPTSTPLRLGVGGKAPTPSTVVGTFRGEPTLGGVAGAVPANGPLPIETPAAVEPPPTPTLGDLLAPLQADIRKNWSLAQLSGDKAQQIAVAQSAVAVFGQILTMATDIGDPGLIADAADALRGWRDTLKGLQEQADPSNDPDLQAQLAQANQRAATNLRAANLAGAFIHTGFSSGDIGRGGSSAWGAATGGTVINVQSLTPSDPATLALIASTVTRAQSGQGFVPASAVSLGV